jgi:death-on-curing protein
MIYFDTAHAIKVHDDIIEISGGIYGVMKLGQLDSIFDFIQSDDYYPNIEDKLCYLFYSINKGHCFNDGNKRASVVLSAYFLELNGLDFRVSRFISEMENIAVDVADDRIDRDLLSEIIMSIICEEDYSEELKLKIIAAKLSGLQN